MSIARLAPPSYLRDRNSSWTVVSLADIRRAHAETHRAKTAPSWGIAVGTTIAIPFWGFLFWGCGPALKAVGSHLLTLAGVA